ncbi:MAG: RecB family exonuclease, partial [Actinomycetota bacterium]
RQRLYCTAAHWYASEDTPKGPSVFLDEILGEDNRDLVDVVTGHLEQPADELNPVVESMRRRLVWPPAPLDDRAHPWLERLETAVADGDAASVLTTAAARKLYDAHAAVIDALASEQVEEPTDVPRRSLPATSAVHIAAGDVSIDDVLHPLPQRPTDAQRLGTEVHAWIEELHRGLVGLAEEEALDEASVPPDRATVDELKRNFQKLRFEHRRPLELSTGEPATELPFTLKIGRDLVRGRIDAVYETEDGGVEIVDFKTGAAPETSFAQLELYAEALAALGIVTGEAKLTFVYLRDGREDSQVYAPRGLKHLEEALGGAGTGSPA